MAVIAEGAEQKLSTQVEMAAASSDTLALGDMGPKQERALLRKIDYHLMPAVGVLYLMSFLDRSNCTARPISMKVRNTQADLKVSQWETQYWRECSAICT